MGVENMYLLSVWATVIRLKPFVTSFNQLNYAIRVSLLSN